MLYNLTLVLAVNVKSVLGHSFLASNLLWPCSLIETSDTELRSWKVSYLKSRIKCTLALSWPTVGRLPTNASANVSTDRRPTVGRQLTDCRYTFEWRVGRRLVTASADGQLILGLPTVGQQSVGSRSTVGRQSVNSWWAVGGWTFTRQQEQEKQATNTITHFKEHLKVLKSTWLYTRAWIFMMLTRSVNVHVKQKTDRTNAAEK